MPAFLIIGNVCYDLRGGQKLLGGPLMYQYPILHSLGVDVYAYTSTTREFPLPTHLSSQIIRAEQPTTYQYSESSEQDDRELVLVAQAADLDLHDLSKFAISFDAVIVSAIANEVSRDFATHMKDYVDSNCFVLDLQTFARMTQLGQPATHSPLSQRDLSWWSERFDIIKGSEIELTTLEKYKISNSCIIIRTSGQSAISVLHRGQIQYFEFEPLASDDIVDATGSGDIFLAAFVYFYLTTHDLPKAIRLAHEIAKAHLSINGIPTPQITKQIISQIILP